MTISIESSFAFDLDKPTDVLLQFEAAKIPEQEVFDAKTRLTETEHCAWVPAQDNIGERIWLRAQGLFEVVYRAKVRLQRQLPDLGSLEPLLPHDMPGEAVQYLFDSRYCPADKFQSFVEAEFGDTWGGARILAFRDWFDRNLTYRPRASAAGPGALDSFIERCGICRDYAHVMVALARASTIPARYVSCYAPGVDPPDFHAVAEVFLNDPQTPGGGTWQLVDATGMADPAQTVKIGVGRDAADVSFITSFGASEFQRSSVKVVCED